MYRVKAIPIKIQACFFVETENCNLKFICKCNGLEKPKYL